MTSRLFRKFCLIAVLFLPIAAVAIDADEQFDDPVLQTRYEAIIAEIRCPMCQNEAIKDSNAMIAEDLRREVARLLRDGRSDMEIYDFLVERYGEFVLYRPRASGKTLYLWLAPGLLLLVGLVSMVQVVRRRAALPIDIDADEQE